MELFIELCKEAYSVEITASDKFLFKAKEFLILSTHQNCRILWIIFWYLSAVYTLLRWAYTRYCRFYRCSHKQGRRHGYRGCCICKLDGDFRPTDILLILYTRTLHRDLKQEKKKYNILFDIDRTGFTQMEGRV